MSRLRFGLAVLAVCVIGSSWLIGADDKKPDEKKPDDPVKFKGTLPQNWGKLGLSNDQKQDIYKVQAKYTAEIDKLKAKIDALKTEEDAERYKILTDDQKKKLKEIKSGEKPDKDLKLKAIADAKVALKKAEDALAAVKDEAQKKVAEKALEDAKAALKKAEDAAKAGDK